MTSLASAFRAGNGRRVKWQGQVVQSVLQLDAGDGARIEIVRHSTSKVRAQAVKVGVDKGDLCANGILMKTAAIWSHTAPERVQLDVVGKRAKSVDIWNCWSFAGVDSAWLGSAGMLVSRDGAGYLLRCSDGIGEPTFDDLVVTVTVHG